MRLLLTAIIVSSSLISFGQSGWTRSKRTYFLKTAFNYFQSSRYYNPSGEKVSTAVFRQQSISIYGEYGLTDRLTGIVNFPVYKWNSFESTNTVSGIGDIKLELKYAILRKYLPLTISIAPEIPTGPSNLYAQNKTVSFERINLPTGDGEFNLWTTLAGSASFHPVPAYISGSVALNYRTKYKDINFQNQLKFNLEVGYKVASLVWVNLILTTQESIGKKTGTSDFVRGNGTSFTGIGLGAAYEFIPHWSVNVQSWTYNDLIFERKNIYSAPTYSIGVFYEIK